MTTIKPKSLTLKVGSRRWAYQGAELRLDDERSGGGFGIFNHPRIVLTFAAPYPWTPSETETATVTIRFQREALDVRDMTHTRLDSPAQGPFDTRVRWSTCYAGRVDLSSRAEIRIGDRPFELPEADQLAVAAARWIARTIRTYNLSAVERDCEAAQALAALAYCRPGVRALYGPGRGVELWEVEDRGANRRHESARLKAEQEAREAQREQEASQSATTGNP